MTTTLHRLPRVGCLAASGDRYAGRTGESGPGLKTIAPYSKAVRTAGLLFVAGQPGVNASIGEAAGSRFAVQGRAQKGRAQKCRYRASDRGLDWVANITV